MRKEGRTLSGYSSVRFELGRTDSLSDQAFLYELIATIAFESNGFAIFRR